MNAIITSVLFSDPVLLAANNLSMAGRRGASSGEVLIYLAVAAAVIGIVMAAVYVGGKQAHARRFNSHASLFTGLCQTHKIDRSGRALLKSLATFHNLAQPARLFCEPQWLSPDHVPPAMKKNEAEIAKLYSQLFRH